MDQQEKYDWGIDYQRQLISLLLHDREFVVQSKGLIAEEYFVNEIHQKIFHVLMEYFGKYNIILNKIAFTEELKKAISRRDPEVVEQHLVELYTCYDYYVPGLDTRDYLLDRITNFAKRQSLKIALYQSLKLINNGNDSDEVWEEVHQTLQKAMTVDRNFELGLDYFQTAAERYQRMKTNVEKGDVFTTGFRSIDGNLNGGGLSRGEIAAWVANSGVGKSLMLVQAAIANLNRGKRVLYISLEIEEDKVAERFDAQLTDPLNEHGVSINNLLVKEEIVKNALDEYVQEYVDPRLLIIKKFPAGTMSVDIFKAYYAQIKMRGFSPDLVIVDYVGEMRDYAKMDIWQSRYLIVRDLGGFADEEKICIMTAMQPGRKAREIQGLGVIDDDALADSFGQIRPLDACWSINQTHEEKNAHLARVFAIKHRDGKGRFIFHVEHDQRTLKFKEISQETFDKKLKMHRNELDVKVNKIAQESMLEQQEKMMRNKVNNSAMQKMAEGALS